MPNYVNFADGDDANAATFNSRLGPLDSQVFTMAGDLDSLQGDVNLIVVDVTAAQTAISTAQTQLTATSDASGIIKPGRVPGTALQPASVATSNIQAKNITPALLSEDAVAPVNLVSDAFNTKTIAGISFEGRERWYRNNAINYLVTVDDSGNTYSGKSLRLPGGSAHAVGGKKIWCDERGLKPGDTITLAIVAVAAGGTYRALLDFRNAADGQIGATVDGTISPTFSGSEMILNVSATIPAGTVSINLLGRRVSGSIDFDMRAMLATKGGYVSSLPTASPYDPSVSPLQNVVSDPFNNRTTPGVDWGGLFRWYQANNLSIIASDVNNPYGGRTLRFSASASPNWGGKLIPLREAGLAVGDKTTYAGRVGASTGSYRIRVWFMDATGINGIGPIYNGLTTDVSTYGVTLTAPTATVPSGAKYVAVFYSRQGGSVPLDIYATWGAAGPDAGPMPAPDTAATDLAAPVSSAMGLVGGMTNTQHLSSWHAAVARVQRNAGIAKIMLVGDSWFQKVDIYQPLRDGLQALYGNGGIGYIGIGNNKGNADIPTGSWSYVRTGTWADSTKQATSKGPDINHSTTTDIATPAQITITVAGNNFRLHYLQQVGGGSFRARINGGAWLTAVNTSGAGDAPMAYAPAAFTGLATGTYVIDVQPTIAGTAGVTLFGLEATNTGSGVLLMNFGNSSSATIHHAQVDALLYQAHVTLHNPDLIAILMTTNDRELNTPLTDTVTNLNTLIDRYRTALPNVAIALIAPSESGSTGKAFASQDYADAMLSVALSRQCAYLSLAELLGSYAKASAIGTMSGIHSTPLGGQVIANSNVKMLKVN